MAVKWLSKVFNPVVEPFEAQITVKITKVKFSSGIRNNSNVATYVSVSVLSDTII